jgi:hypothetical protein
MNILTKRECGMKLMTKSILKTSRSVLGLISLTLAIGLGQSLTATLPATAQNPPPPSQFSGVAINYRVIVDSADAQVLQQVRQVERAAFFQQFADNRDRIQAGAFAGEVGARERVDALARIGVGSSAYNMQGQVIYSRGGGQVQQPYYPPNTPQPPGGNLPGNQTEKQRPRGYYAIVPIRQDQLRGTYTTFQNLGIPEAQIVYGTQLRGWHVGVGVYSDRAAAERMSQFLKRKGGLDARTYFEP